VDGDKRRVLATESPRFDHLWTIYDHLCGAATEQPVVLRPHLDEDWRAATERIGIGQCSVAEPRLRLKLAKDSAHDRHVRRPLRARSRRGRSRVSTHRVGASHDPPQL